jgi:O-antigen ligase
MSLRDAAALQTTSPTAVLDTREGPPWEAGGASPATPGFSLTSEEKRVLYTCAACCITALLLPYPPVKVVAGVVLAATFFRIAFRYYYMAVALFIFFLPLQEVGGGASFLLPGLNLQTAFVCFFIGLALLQTPETSEPDAPAQPAPLVRNPVTAPLGCLLVILLLSAFHSAAATQWTLWSQLTNLKNSFIYCVFFWLCFAKIRRNHEKLVIVMFVFLSVLFNVAVSLRNVFETLSAALIFLRHRAASLISDQPNLYGGFLALYLFFFIGFLLYYPMPKRHRTLLGVCTGLVALNLLYTLSRGAWLAAALVTVFVVVTKSLRMLVPLGVFVVALLLSAPGVVVERWQSTMTSNEYRLEHLAAGSDEADEAASRVIQWRTFPTMLMLNPIFGIGKGNYAETHFAMGYDEKARTPHSSIISLGVEEGVFGLACYLWLLRVIYREATRRFRTVQDPIERALSFGTLAATLCLFFLDFTGMRFFSGQIMAYYWILTGITLNIDSTAQPA